MTQRAGVSVPEAPQPEGGAAEGSAGDELDALRRLLLRPEQQRIEQLSERLDDPLLHARDVSRVLPDAMRLAAGEGERLGAALAPTVEEIIRDSVRRDSRTFADALFPVMGPAIRKAMAETLKQMLQSFSEMLDNSFSWQGLRWRLEAWRTGRPFAEVVMLHSLVFRVEQVFLIHRQSGVLLQHLAAEHTAFQDADLVSGMLTAIQDFVRDSFGIGAEQNLDSIQVGDFTVWVESGPEAVLAVAIRGNAPEALRGVLHDVLETIHLQQAEALRDFQGDPAPFESEAVREVLGRCLQARYRERRRRLSPLLLVLLLGALGGAGYWALGALREHLAFSDFLGRLEAEPGILVTAAEAEGDGYLLRGLRDPLAADPASLVGGGVLAGRPMVFRFEPYQALAPRFVLARARRLLQPPETVRLSLADGVLRLEGRAPYSWVEAGRRLALALPGVARLDDGALEAEVDLAPLEAPQGVRLAYSDGLLTATGSAPYAWIRAARGRALLIPGVRRYDDSGLQIEPDLSSLEAPKGVRLEFADGRLRASGSAPHAWIVRARRTATRIPGVRAYTDDGLLDQDLTRLRALQAGLEREVILFGVDTSRREGAEGLRDIAGRIRRLARLAGELGRSVQIVLVGHTDTSGRDQRNLHLSQARADWVHFQLVAAGVDPQLLRTRAAGTREPVSTDDTPQGMALNRSVTLEVHLSGPEGGEA